MNYGEPTPADPIISHASDPSSPPSLEEPHASSSNGVVPIGRFPQVKLRIKFGTPNSNSNPQVMSNAVAYPYGNSAGDDEHESGDDSNGFQFSGVDANAVRSQMDKEASPNDSDANNSNDEEAHQRPKRDRKKRESDPASANSSAKKGGKGRGRKAKEVKKEKKEEEEGDGEEEEEEVYEVERIFDHTLGEDGQILYKVKWVGYGPEYDTYEPEGELGSAKQRINEYKRSLPVETRAELENLSSGRSKKRGRPSKGASAKASKKVRVSLPQASDASDNEEGEKESEDDDDDFALEDKPTSSTSRSRGRQTATRGGKGGKGRPAKNKAELKLFAAPFGSSPAKRPHVEARAQKWLDTDDDSSDEEEAAKKAAAKDKKTDRSVSQSPAPSARRDAASKKRGAREVEGTPSNGARNRWGSGGLTIDGVYRTNNGEVEVVLTEGRAGQRLVPLQEAHDLAGFKLVQFFIDRCQFTP